MRSTETSDQLTFVLESIPVIHFLSALIPFLARS